MIEHLGQKQNTCVVCKTELSTLPGSNLDLGVQPLANQLLNSSEDSFNVAPLGFNSCFECGHAQLSHFVEPDILFANYLYQSGTSNTLKSFFTWFAQTLQRALSRSETPGPHSVLEIACNDGSLLDPLKDCGFLVEGIDPARNLVDIAKKKGHSVYADFFPSDKLSTQYDVIIGMNVLAHTPEPQALMCGIANTLKPNGVALLQTSQALMLENFEFDTIYHEHYSFFTVPSLKRLAEQAGLKLEKVQFVSVHGTSFVFILRHRDYQGAELAFNADSTFAIEQLGTSVPAFAESHSTALVERYAQFTGQATKTLEQVKKTVENYRTRGYKIALLGVAAKSLTFLNAGDIHPDYYVDEAVLKIGKFIPGRKGAILSIEQITHINQPILFLIGAWNFAEELSKKIQQHMKSSEQDVEHQFLIYFPKFKVFS